MTDPCPVCKKELNSGLLPPWPQKAKTPRGRRFGLCRECDEALFPPDGDEYQWDRLQGAVRRLGGSLVIGGTNWTGSARPDVAGMKKALDDMNCQGMGRISMLQQMEHAIEEAVRFALLNAVASPQYKRYKLVITIENCTVEYTTVPTGGDFEN